MQVERFKTAAPLVKSVKYKKHSKELIIESAVLEC